MSKVYRLLKPLPGCPVGRVFKQIGNGEYYHSITDAEALQDGLRMYYFDKNEVEGNPDFFEEMLSDNYYVKIFNPKNLDEYELVDTGLSEYIVDVIKQSLNDISTNLENSDRFSVTPMIILPQTYDLHWGIVERKDGVSKLKCRVTITKEDENNRSK
jgi:hypothetical protein